jgi:hypothetical protein
MEDRSGRRDWRSSSSNSSPGEQGQATLVATMKNNKGKQIENEISRTVV